MDKPFFVGQRSLRIIEKRPRKQKLVGFALDAAFRGEAPKECHLVIRDGDIAGRVTSIAFSESLGRHVGLAFVAPELAQEGTRFNIRADGGRMVEAEVVKTPFYDPAAERQTMSATSLRRSPLHDLLDADSPQWARAAWRCWPRLSCPATMPALPIVLADASCLPRMGVKGPQAEAGCAAVQVSVPEAPNAWTRTADGVLVARLARSEFFLEDGSAAITVERLRHALAARAGCLSGPASGRGAGAGG